MTLSYHNSPDTRFHGKTITSKPNSIYHEPSPHLYRAWSNPLKTESLQHGYPHPKASPPNTIPVLYSSRASLVWETNQKGQQFFGLALLLIDVPIKPKKGSKDEKNLELLKSLEGETNGNIDLNKGYHFRPMVVEENQEQNQEEKLGKSYYDLIHVKQDGSEVLLTKNAGWTYDENKIQDLTESNAYSKRSLIGKVDSKIPTISLLFSISPSSFPLWFDDSHPLLISRPLNPYKRIFTNFVNFKKVRIFYKGDDKKSSDSLKDPILLAEMNESYFCHENSCPLRVYFDRKNLKNELDFKLLGEINETGNSSANGKEFKDFKTACPYKGVARYYDLEFKSKENQVIKLENKIWTYPNPVNECLDLKDLICFWVPGPSLQMVIDDEVVEP